MKKIVLLMGVLWFYLPAGQAADIGSTYLGLQYALVTYDEQGFDDVEPTALVSRFGRFVTANVAIEGRLGLGLQDDEVDVGSFDIDVEVDSLLGAYALFQSETSNDNSFYGIVGFTRGEIEGSAFGITVSTDESGLSYGFGANIGRLNIEYMSYLDDDDFDTTAISIGYVAVF